jgi:hypothetical protein
MMAASQPVHFFGRHLAMVVVKEFYDIEYVPGRGRVLGFKPYPKALLLPDFDYRARSYKRRELGARTAGFFDIQMRKLLADT